MCFLFLFCVAVFAVSFVCSGKKSGEVDMTFKLNYTGVESGLIDTEDVKTFMMVIRRECNKTGMCLQCSLLFVACNQCIDGNFAYKMDSKTRTFTVNGESGKQLVPIGISLLKLQGK